MLTLYHNWLCNVSKGLKMKILLPFFFLIKLPIFIQKDFEGQCKKSIKSKKKDQFYTGTQKKDK